MALSTPYPGVTPPYKGNVTETQDDLNAWIERVHRAGIQVNCHANGDVAIDMMLTAVERAQQLFPRADARPKITHCTLINDDLVRRMKAAGAVPAPFTSYAYYNSDKFHFYGEELMKRCMAYRTFLDAGIRGGGGLGLQSGTVRSADGHSGNGDAHRLERRDLGSEPAHQRGRGAAGQHDQRRLQLTRGSDQRIHHAGQTGGLRRAGGRSSHGGSRRRSRTSRSSARWSAGRRFTRREEMMRRVLSLAFICWSGYGQTGSPIAFDAVSVKMSRPPSPGTMPRIECRGGPETKDPELWICRNAPLRMLLQLAYNMRAFQVDPFNVRGGPFDIVARVEPGASRDQFRLMVQGFLAERFHLALHWDTKEMPVYDLVVGKGGPKLKESSNQAEEAIPGAETKLPKPRLGEDGYPVLPPEFSGVTMMVATNGAPRTRLHGLHETMEDLAAMLTIRLGRPVIDKTELNGAYDILLSWEMDGYSGAGAPATAPSVTATPSVVQVEHGPSLETALQEQLGLKLVGKKDDVKVLVVDHVDSSPSDN